MSDASPGANGKKLGAPLYLFRKTGAAQFVILAGLMLAASLSEGVGLLMFVPLTRAVAGGGQPAELIGWFAPLEQMPFPALLVAAVVLVALRAVLVYALNDRSTLGVCRKSAVATGRTGPCLRDSGCGSLGTVTPPGSTGR